ncbi:MAG: bifunctional homocysteine S-methyltransferase/methylenetetrahydrofolate reductase [Candidatus Marinimicrobia bacterium]|nr:bifunctional homocysteine S-methyltransferase/methylenetetrahydrofolate reductase [Candidatus Neomarinimicrobiota bacterium]
MARGEFLNYLKDNIVLFDGAMGTMLYSRGIYINRCFDELNLSRPELVKEIHNKYILAGSEVIETNTFGANRFKLNAHGFDEEVSSINYQGARIAREEAGEDIWVAGSIGPLGIRIEPWGPTSVEEARDVFKEQAKALYDGGIDLFILETFYDLGEIQQAIIAVKEICDLPVIAQMTIGDDGNSLYGTTPEHFAKRLSEWGSDVVGINCSVGPQIMLNALEKMVRVADKPISIQPNAGVPRNIEGRNIYLVSAEYMADYTKRFIQTGAKIIGGCCGTTPEHIRAMRDAIQSVVPHRREIKIKVTRKAEIEFKPTEIEKKSKFALKIANHKFVKTVELVPPKGIDTSEAVSITKLLKKKCIDAVNIPDGPRALSRMGAIYLSKIIIDKVGVEPILHYTCRDRNLLGIMSDLLGIHAIGIRNILLITGDPPKMGDYPDATAVFDIDSIGLTNVVNNLNHGVDLGGNPIGQPTEYFIGVGVNPGAIDLDYELRRFEWKVKAGAEFAITQPVFDTEIFFDFLEEIKGMNIPIIAGIWPLVSLRNAEFMNNEVPGAKVPEYIMEKMRATKTKSEALKVGLNIAHETIRQIYLKVAGVQVSMPFGNVDYPLKVLEVISKMENI